jgi:hypothetical protein
MEQLPGSIILTIAILTLFLMFVTGLKYARLSHFSHTRLMMTAFFFFIIATLSVSYWDFAFITFPYSIPAALMGIVVGWLLGARAAKERMRLEGPHYLEHFAHVHLHELKKLTWWSFFNYYTVMAALLLINCVGLTTVIFNEARNWVILTSVVGAFLLGTLVPYLIHVWTIRPAHPSNNTQSE